jgi:signal transduction histidine kinase
MIDNLLAFTRTDPDQARLRLSRFALRPLIEEAVELLRAEIDAKQIDVVIEMEDEGTRIHGDRDRLLEVLLNLLSNAVKFNRRAGAIGIRSKPGQSGYAAVTVRDTGIGIPQEFVGRIFDRHFRVERSGDERTEGSGLGLSIVRDILRLHGCTIHVDSEEGRGTAFTFTLPLSLAPAAAPPAVPEAEGPAPSAPPHAEVRRESEPESAPEAEPAPRLRIIRRAKPES